MTAASAPDVMVRNVSNSPITPLIHFSSSKVRGGSSCSVGYSESVVRRQGQMSSRIKGDSSPALHALQEGVTLCLEHLTVLSYETLTSFFLISLWRCPVICRLGVMTNTEESTAFARSIKFSPACPLAPTIGKPHCARFTFVSCRSCCRSPRFLLTLLLSVFTDFILGLRSKSSNSGR